LCHIKRWAINRPWPLFSSYRDLFRNALAQTAIDDIRLAFNQNQPIGNAHFIE